MTLLGPEGPVGPVGPVLPVLPFEPDGPVGPVGPWNEFTCDVRETISEFMVLTLEIKFETSVVKPDTLDVKSSTFYVNVVTLPDTSAIKLIRLQELYKSLGLTCMI